MHLPTPLHRSPATPEDVFATKHAWLFRWALHFCQNDRAAAEDLVQDCFVKLLLSWSTLTEIENIEPVLYSYLKYSHLTEIRRRRNYSFHNLSTIDFDTFTIRLRMASEADLLMLQNELRRIVSYLLWRKPSAKYASMFLLRFFHGYFPEEITRICLVTRHAVDLSLRYARQELKAYLANGHQIHESLIPSPPECETRYMPLSTHEFAEELRDSIFAAGSEVCVLPHQLMLRYRESHPKPLDSETLSHVVSCKHCLDMVSQARGLLPPSGRSPGDTVGSAPHAKRGRDHASSKSRQPLARIMDESRSRMRESQDHRTNGLVLAINGEVLAVRDLSSKTAVLKVDTHSIETLELIEVWSEQGVPLLVFPVLQKPPVASPEVAHTVEMSDGRTVSLLIRFTFDGALMEVTYYDSSYPRDHQQETLETLQRALNEVEPQPVPEKTSPARRRWRILEGLQSLRLLRWGPSAIFAVLLLLSAAPLLFLHFHRHGAASAAALLQNAEAAERMQATEGKSGVVRQQVSIRADNRSISRTLHRDLQRRRRPKIEAQDPNASFIHTMLDRADIPWNDPLSVSSYKTWHDRTLHPSDEVESSEDGLVTLSTRSDDPQIREESLTIRVNDFHPMRRKVEFRNDEVVEIAEISYSISPWDGDNSEAWFEPDTTGHGAALRAPAPIRIPFPQRLSDSQLMEAQLQVMLVLKQLDADTERLEVKRMATGVRVNGVVESDERKRQISSALIPIPHVTVQILSYRDLDRASPGSANPTSVSAVSVGSDTSPMSKYCEDHHLHGDECRRMSHQLLNAATALVRESKQIQDLLNGFSSSSPLTTGANRALKALLLRDVTDIQSLLLQEQSVLTSLGDQTIGPQTDTPATAASLVRAAENNLSYSKRLLYSGDGNSESAEACLAELARSSVLIRTSLMHLPGALLAGPDSSRSAQTP